MEIFNARIVQTDISNWEWHVALLNVEQAAQFWITANDKISLIRRWEEYVVDVALSTFIKPGEIGATEELLKAYPFQETQPIQYLLATIPGNLYISQV